VRERVAALALHGEPSDDAVLAVLTMFSSGTGDFITTARAWELAGHTSYGRDMVWIILRLDSAAPPEGEGSRGLFRARHPGDEPAAWDEESAAWLRSALERELAPSVRVALVSQFSRRGAACLAVAEGEVWEPDGGIEPREVVAAIGALAFAGNDPGAAALTMSRLLAHPDAGVRLVCAQELEEWWACSSGIGARAETVRSALAEAMEDSEDEVARTAAAAYRRWRAPAPGG
jgi:hypothetical protein